tara:strand:- start:676 stop:1977 length:1302 start_codon:yes stop_codon:yes gene_type:complete
MRLPTCLKGKNLCLFFFVTLFTLGNVFACDGLVEEGWRYRMTLKVEFFTEGSERPVIIDDERLLQIHGSMAAIDVHARTSEAKTIFATLRVTPVLKSLSRRPEYSLGRTHPLPNVLIQDDSSLETPRFEIVASSKSVDLNTLDSKAMGRSGVVLPPCHFESYDHQGMFVFSPSGNFVTPFFYLKRNYFSPSILEQRLRQYLGEANGDGASSSASAAASSSSASIVSATSVVDPEYLHRVHDMTLDSLRQRQESLIRELTHLPVRKVHELSEAKKKAGAPSFNVNPMTNSYTCAEQTLLDYVHTDEVQQRLGTLKSHYEEDFVGMLVHIHTSETPCSCCATSLVRECEKDGIFPAIFEVPCFLIETCGEHYQRKGEMLSYDKTRSMGPGPESGSSSESKTIRIAAEQPHIAPFIILEEDETGNRFEIVRPPSIS